jgi:hypothetical protein
MPDAKSIDEGSEKGGQKPDTLPVSKGRKLMRFPAWELGSLREFRPFDPILVNELGWEFVEKEPQLAKGLIIHNPQDDNRKRKLEEIQVGDRVSVESGEYFGREAIVLSEVDEANCYRGIFSMAFGFRFQLHNLFYFYFVFVLFPSLTLAVQLQADLEEIAQRVKLALHDIKLAKLSTEKDRREQLLAAKQRHRELVQLLQEKTEDPRGEEVDISVDDLEQASEQEEAADAGGGEAGRSARRPQGGCRSRRRRLCARRSLWSGWCSTSACSGTAGRSR